jgi:guanylate kinase
MLAALQCSSEIEGLSYLYITVREFDEWIAIAKDRLKWRQLTHSIPKPPDA